MKRLWKPVDCPRNSGTAFTWSWTSIVGTGSFLAEKSNRVKNVFGPRWEASMLTSMSECPGYTNGSSSTRKSLNAMVRE